MKVISVTLCSFLSDGERKRSGNQLFFNPVILHNETQDILHDFLFGFLEVVDGLKKA